MAHVIIEDEAIIARTWRSWLQTIAIGAGTGLAAWVFTAVISRYVIEPLACGATLNAAVCSDATGMAGNIATIIVTTIAVIVMVRLRVIRPIIIAVASAALLWGLAAWAEGLFWLEIIAWSIGLYAIAYGLFSWIARSTVLWLAIVLSILIVLSIRLIVLV